MMNRKLLLVIIISIFFIPFAVNAEICENNKISIESIEIKSISDKVVEKNDPIINGMGVKLDLEMSEVDDSIEYEMTIKNDSESDYKLDKDSLNIESDYFEYTFETKDKTNIVKAKSSSDAVLIVQYKKEVPEELLNNGSFTDNKMINIRFNEWTDLINPKTGQSSLCLNIILLLIISIISLFVLKKNRKINALLLLIFLSFPVSVWAVCELNLKIETSVGIKGVDNSDIVAVTDRLILRKSGYLYSYSSENLSYTPIEATTENINDKVIAARVKYLHKHHYLTDEGTLYYIDDSNNIKIIMENVSAILHEYSDDFIVCMNNDASIYQIRNDKIGKITDNLSKFYSAEYSNDEELLKLGHVYDGLYIINKQNNFIFLPGRPSFYEGEEGLIEPIDLSQVEDLYELYIKLKDGKLFEMYRTNKIVINGGFIFNAHHRLVGDGEGNIYDDDDWSKCYNKIEGSSLYGKRIKSITESQWNNPINSAKSIVIITEDGEVYKSDEQYGGQNWFTGVFNKIEGLDGIKIVSHTYNKKWLPDSFPVSAYTHKVDVLRDNMGKTYYLNGTSVSTSDYYDGRWDSTNNSIPNLMQDSHQSTFVYNDAYNYVIENGNIKNIMYDMRKNNKFELYDSEDISNSSVYFNKENGVWYVSLIEQVPQC